MDTEFSKLLGRRVKAVFEDDGKNKVVIGILNEVNKNYIVIDNAIIGLGDNFIFCVPQTEDRNGN